MKSAYQSRSHEYRVKTMKPEKERILPLLTVALTTMLSNAMVTREQAFRVTGAVCNLRTNCTLCDTCNLESREDFYLLLLTRLKDECDDYFGLEAKCVDMREVIDHYSVLDVPVMMFDESVHRIDENAMALLGEHAVVGANEAVPVMVAGDGDCLFHSFKTFYPTMNIDELRARTIVELCCNKNYYETIKTEMNLELVDDESVEKHVLRIANNQEYTGMLTIAALSTALGQTIESVYPNINENDPYCEVLNNVFTPRDKSISTSETSLRIMWSGPERKTDRIWTPNHFVPLLPIHQLNSSITITTDITSMDDDIMHVESTKVPSKTVLRANRSKITYTSQITDAEGVGTETKDLPTVFDKRQIFLEAPAIIQHMIDAVKEGKVFEQPPKMVTHASMFTIKLTEENRLSIGKDGNGIWSQMRSVKTMFMLKESHRYQIVRQDSAGQLFYNERVGDLYQSCPVNPNQVIILHR